MRKLRAHLKRRCLLLRRVNNTCGDTQKWRYRLQRTTAITAAVVGAALCMHGEATRVLVDPAVDLRLGSGAMRMEEMSDAVKSATSSLSSAGRCTQQLPRPQFRLPIIKETAPAPRHRTRLTQSPVRESSSSRVHARVPNGSACEENKDQRREARVALNLRPHSRRSCQSTKRKNRGSTSVVTRPQKLSICKDLNNDKDFKNEKDLKNNETLIDKNNGNVSPGVVPLTPSASEFVKAATIFGFTLKSSQFPRNRAMLPKVFVVQPHFENVKHLGYGTVGDILEVVTKDKRMALKVTPQQNDWEREVAALLRIQGHNNVVTLLGTGVWQGRYCIALGLCEETLISWLNSSDASGSGLRAILQGVRDGMRYLSNLTPSVVHGDLKADNILLEAGVPKVTDFSHSHFTADEKDVLRLYYISSHRAPELWKPGSTPSKEADVFAYSKLMQYSMACLGARNRGDPTGILALERWNKRCLQTKMEENRLEQAQVDDEDDGVVSTHVRGIYEEPNALDLPAEFRDLSRIYKACGATEFSKRPSFDTFIILQVPKDVSHNDVDCSE